MNWKVIFSDIFSTSLPDDHAIGEVLDCVEQKVSLYMSESLGDPFTTDDVRDALFGMGAWKSPGPPMVSMLDFFKRIGDLLGADVTRVCLEVLNGQRSIRLLNATYIVLMPKIKSSKEVSNFRPISLCVYEIITKTIANRLKGYFVGYHLGRTKCLCPW